MPDVSRGGCKTAGGPVNVLLYDCTTLAFDTEREDDHAVEVPDRLLVKNFNKDGRHFRSQIMLAGGKEFRIFDFQNADRLVSVVLNCFDGLGQCFVDAFQYEPGRSLIHEINILGLANHCAMRRILAISAQNIELLGVRFQSLASRRHLPSHVKVRSTIHHLGRRVNPMAPCGRLTISRFQHLARKAYPFCSDCISICWSLLASPPHFVQIQN